MSGYIYLFSDPCDPSASKIGYDASKGCASSWTAAPSYSPRPMAFVAAWEIPGRLLAAAATPGAGRKAVETALHQRCGGKVADLPGRRRAGRDWVTASPAEAERVITQYMGSAPSLRDAHKRRVVTNDNFRNPHPDKVAGHRHKIAVWIYREVGTGLLKTQFCDDWASPHEVQRRYSVNGIEELAAFTYAGPVRSEANTAVLDAWRGAVSEFGFGPADRHYGWLRPEARPGDVAAFYAARGLTACVVGRDAPVPQGIRPAYNRS